ncbi:hypothetical protein SNEBB_001272 [Seison nebaliae]|nr:hypothetical protein SNEBB_001272 [Seison nebaliae]
MDEENFVFRKRRKSASSEHSSMNDDNDDNGVETSIDDRRIMGESVVEKKETDNKNVTDELELELHINEEDSNLDVMIKEDEVSSNSIQWKKENLKKRIDEQDTPSHQQKDLMIDKKKVEQSKNNDIKLHEDLPKLSSFKLSEMEASPLESSERTLENVVSESSDKKMKDIPSQSSDKKVRLEPFDGKVENIPLEPFDGKVENILVESSEIFQSEIEDDIVDEKSKEEKEKIILDERLNKDISKENVIPMTIINKKCESIELFDDSSLNVEDILTKNDQTLITTTTTTTTTTSLVETCLVESNVSSVTCTITTTTTTVSSSMGKGKIGENLISDLKTPLSVNSENERKRMVKFAKKEVLSTPRPKRRPTVDNDQTLKSALKCQEEMENRRRSASASNSKIAIAKQKAIDKRKNRSRSLMVQSGEVSESFSIRHRLNRLNFNDDNPCMNIRDLKLPSGYWEPIEIYEFLFPTLFCGALIGKKGSFVQEIIHNSAIASLIIRNDVRAIYCRQSFRIPHHIVAIEGTTTSIKIAMAIIKKRFPKQQLDKCYESPPKRRPDYNYRRNHYHNNYNNSQNQQQQQQQIHEYNNRPNSTMNHQVPFSSRPHRLRNGPRTTNLAAAFELSNILNMKSSGGKWNKNRKTRNKKNKKTCDNQQITDNSDEQQEQFENESSKISNETQIDNIEKKRLDCEKLSEKIESTLNDGKENKENLNMPINHEIITSSLTSLSSIPTPSSSVLLPSNTISLDNNISELNSSIDPSSNKSNSLESIELSKSLSSEPLLLSLEPLEQFSENSQSPTNRSRRREKVTRIDVQDHSNQLTENEERKQVKFHSVSNKKMTKSPPLPPSNNSIRRSSNSRAHSEGGRISHYYVLNPLLYQIQQKYERRSRSRSKEATKNETKEENENVHRDGSSLSSSKERKKSKERSKTPDILPALYNNQYQNYVNNFSVKNSYRIKPLASIIHQLDNGDEIIYEKVQPYDYVPWVARTYSRLNGESDTSYICIPIPTRSKPLTGEVKPNSSNNQTSHYQPRENVIFERSSFATNSTWDPFPEYMPLPNITRISLPEAVDVNVRVCHIMSAGHIFVQQSTHPSFPHLSDLADAMYRVYEQEKNAPHLRRPVTEGEYCAAPVILEELAPISGDNNIRHKVTTQMHPSPICKRRTSERLQIDESTVLDSVKPEPILTWQRAQIVTYNPELDEVLLYLLDVGGFLRLPSTDCRRLKTSFYHLPAQAVECYLDRVYPLPGQSNYSIQSTQYLNEIVVQSERLYAVATAHAVDGNSIICLFTVLHHNETLLNVNRQLLRGGYVTDNLQS